MNVLNDDLQWYIYRLYFSKHVLSIVYEKASMFHTRLYFKNVITPQLLTHSVGNRIADLINDHMADCPLDVYVQTYNVADWDNLLYFYTELHLQKKIDLFLFVTLKDVLRTIRPST